mmetsp:Transcript_612/g.1810  ORF Transcript_612/g.1810 Transcript_612/m.1810 type:complete len:512 (-) Transcript_612:233-1768(-)
MAYSLVPRAPEVLRLLGVLHLHQRSTETASRILQLAVKANENDPLSWLALANAKEHMSIKQCSSKTERDTMEMAIHAYKKAIQLQIHGGSYIFAQVLNNLGVLQFELGHVKSAAAALHAALKNVQGSGADSDSTVGSIVDVEASLLWRWKAEASCHKHVLSDNDSTGKVSSASDSSRNDGILDDPQDSQILQRQTEVLATMWTNLAQLYRSLGNYPIASEFARAALKVNPRSVRCLLLLARLHLDINQHEHAQSYIESAVNLALPRISENAAKAMESSHSQAADALAVACVLQSKVKDAVKTVDLLRMLCKMSDSSVYSHLTLAHVHMSGLVEHCSGVRSMPRRVHQLRFASEYARSVLKMTPSCSVAAHVLGLSLLELGQLDDAAIIFERLRESVSRSRIHSCSISWDSTVNLAHSYCLTGRWTEAAAVYTACLRMPPAPVAEIPWGVSVIQSRRAELSHWLAHAYQGSENKSGASRGLAAAIHLRPNDQQFHGTILSANANGYGTRQGE